MKDNELDDLLRVAIANMRQPEPSEAFREAISGAGRAPLAALIDKLLEEQPNVSARSALKAIAGLNQGCVEDLDTPVFQSYLIARLGITEAQVRQCMRSIGTFAQLIRSSAEQRFLAAARDEQGNGGGSASADDIREQLKKRKK
jgi:hypothetical protein